MVNLIIISLAPVFIIALYIYFRDKYDREPIIILIRALLLGVLITAPVIFIENYLGILNESMPGIKFPLFRAFVVAGFTEELFKYLAFVLFIWKSRHFNEKFDGIVYAAFISLGFAAVENVIYVTGYGVTVGLVRAFSAVPAHALFGIVMGYHLGLAKFCTDERTKQLILAFLIPFLLHGFYDFFLMSGKSLLLLLFVPFIILLWIQGFRRMKDLSDSSSFRYIDNNKEYMRSDQSEEDLNWK